MPKLPKLPAGGIRIVVIAIIVLIVMSSSVYTIEPEEVGVLVRLGRFSGINDPGLHFKLPLGIDKMFKVAVQRQLKQEFGFRTLEPGVRSQFTTAGSAGRVQHADR